MLLAANLPGHKTKQPPCFDIWQEKHDKKKTRNHRSAAATKLPWQPPPPTTLRGQAAESAKGKHISPISIDPISTPIDRYNESLVQACQSFLQRMTRLNRNERTKQRNVQNVTSKLRVNDQLRNDSKRKETSCCNKKQPKRSKELGGVPWASPLHGLSAIRNGKNNHVRKTALKNIQLLLQLSI